MTPEERTLLSSILETLNTVAYSSLISLEKQGNNAPEKIKKLENNQKTITDLIVRFRNI